MLDDDDDDEDYVDDDDGYEDDEFGSWRRACHQWYPPHEEPQEAGEHLLMGGDFGPIANKIASRRTLNKNIAQQIRNRHFNSRLLHPRETFSRDLVPNSMGTVVATFDANVYTAQFSEDSSFFYTCAQDFRLHVFDTTAMPNDVGGRLPTRGADPGLQTSLRVKKSVQGHPGRWTITDANLSPDNERLIYASIAPTVYMTNIQDESSAQIPIPFSDPRPGRRDTYYSDDHFGIWSCRFSADGNEVIAGGNGYIFVYDLLANRRTVKIHAHDDDVNSCCWADTASGNVLVSASDDTYLKVWDRRSLGSSQKPSGVLVGHTEGITYVSAKGDGRYVISNGKDQALRLWDLRKMRTSEELDRIGRNEFSAPHFDYRYPNYPKPRRHAHPKDCSVMTYRGHSVLRTLIRCHFSPSETTGGQYIYSGSADGRIHIWSLDGTIVQVLDRTSTYPLSFDPSEPELGRPKGKHSSCVRDVSWHSHEPVLMSAGWDGGRGGSSLARHEWKGLSKLKRLEDVVEKERQEAASSPSRRRSNRLSTSVRGSSRRNIPGAFMDLDDDLF
ncbi:WD40 repeat-like protein [Pleurotus eryngii]|uniref:WD40 repeat-like protein n=1 Tax=Pleurotus eryngii TaxID=5323 RepID=A0A9P6DKP5_PLEER|nr:WD40 repeat-like protein [Pleurotus eryngii]